MSNTTSKDTKDAKEKKVRVFTLAKELNVESKLLLDYCKELGYADITNQLSGLLPEQADALKERTKKGPKAGPGHPPAPAPGVPPKNVIPSIAKQPIQTIPKPLPKPAAKPAEPVAPVVAQPAAPRPLFPRPRPCPRRPSRLHLRPRPLWWPRPR
ncbi:hypothetical protein VT84_37350 [Gemmata sp. SH-PL17]|uniref:translation initiation factor IF-2 N-terminal domain-containing protein n=1 Tax=Gemmata sp. SH-PL17 TaxID=1630693 RepID=UPI00078DC644|nr:translation initiation factor IF-2 N-terminal domain-containing protein [Gemmata sp. SH-PL17]AMV30120.1 hypothetical protein VT84_37350 [Gemmata sp. SH-PL17]